MDFQNKKTGHLYTVVVRALDATNDACLPNKPMEPFIVYHKKGDPGQVFIRKEKEFWEKFEPSIPDRLPAPPK